jgi:hypothetical protein
MRLAGLFRIGKSRKYPIKLNEEGLSLRAINIAFHKLRMILFEIVQSNDSTQEWQGIERNGPKKAGNTTKMTSSKKVELYPPR